MRPSVHPAPPELHFVQSLLGGVTVILAKSLGIWLGPGGGGGCGWRPEGGGFKWPGSQLDDFFLGFLMKICKIICNINFLINQPLACCWFAGGMDAVAVRENWSSKDGEHAWLEEV